MDTRKQQPDNDDINLLEYWEILLRRRRLIGIVTGAAAALAVILSLLLPNIYSSKASVLPPQDESIGSSMLSQASLPLAGLAGGFLGLQSPVDTWVGILNSDSVRDAVIEKFKLREVYGEDSIEDTRKALAKAVSVEKSDEEIISVVVEDEDPKRAAEMANAFMEELDKVNKRVVMTSGKRTRLFIEDRLKEARAEMTRIEDDMKAFQEKNSAVKLDDQSKVIIEAIGTVKGELLAKEVQLQTLESYATPENPMVQVLQREVDGLRMKMNELESGKGRGTIFIPTSRMPELNLRYLRHLRDAKIQETLFELLTQQYEIARIQEAKDSPTVQVLDFAKPAEEKSKPKRGLICVGATMAGFLAGVFGAFFKEFALRASQAR